MIRKANDRGGFTLLELLVCIVIIAILSVLFFAASDSIRDRTRTVQCVSNLRSIVAGTISWTTDRDGMLWSKQETGNSKFRMVDDDLGLPKILEKYVPKKCWLCPAGRPALDIFGNNYQWTIASQFETRPVITIESPKTTVLYWDAFGFSLPSMKNASENPDGSSGPTALNAKYNVYPHRKKAEVNWAYLDGHVETRPK